MVRFKFIHLDSACFCMTILFYCIKSNMSIACVLPVLTQYMWIYCYQRCHNWQYGMAVHRNLVYSVWVLFDHFILSNDQDAELPLWHRHSGGYKVHFWPCVTERDLCSVTHFWRLSAGLNSSSNGGAVVPSTFVVLLIPSQDSSRKFRFPISSSK